MQSSAKNVNIKVFMYHRIVRCDYDGGDRYAVSEDNFRKQLKILDVLNFTPITFEDYQLYLEDKLTLPRKPVILTFNNGYRNTYEVAIPILREFDMKAVIYATGNRNLSYAFWEQENEKETLPLMTDDQLIEVHKEGFEIGAHSMTHPSLPMLSGEEQVKEIIGSKESLEQLLGEEVLSFAYPYGSFNDETYEITKKAGFRFACGIHSGPVKFGDDTFNIQRLKVGYNTGRIAYLMKLLTPYGYFQRLGYKLRNKKSGTRKFITKSDFPKMESERKLKNRITSKSMY